MQSWPGVRGPKAGLLPRWADQGPGFSSYLENPIPSWEPGVLGSSSLVIVFSPRRHTADGQNPALPIIRNIP